MIIGVAGPYSAATQEERDKNLERMNMAAARLLEMGHIPLVGVNAALPVIKYTKVTLVWLLRTCTGAGFESKNIYGSGLFQMRIKVPGGNSGGVVTAFYVRLYD